MTKFDVGDLVVLNDNYFTRNPDERPEAEGIVYVVLRGPQDFDKTSPAYGKYYEVVDLRDGGLKGLAHLDEIDPYVQETTTEIPVGTRVRCANGSIFRGEIGTVIHSDADRALRHHYRVKWDTRGEIDLNDINDHGGWWSAESLEVVDESTEVNEILVKTLLACKAQFTFYAKQHLAKAQAKDSMDSYQKALANEGMVALIDKAIAASQ